MEKIRVSVIAVTDAIAADLPGHPPGRALTPETPPLSRRIAQ
jgi:hypothetical protein